MKHKTRNINNINNNNIINQKQDKKQIQDRVKETVDIKGNSHCEKGKTITSEEWTVGLETEVIVLPITLVKEIKTMNTAIDQAAAPSVRAFCKGKDGRKPPGTKTLQLFLPMQLYFHVQAQAALSQLEIRQYVGQFLVEAFPLSPTVLQQNVDNSTALFAAMRNDKLDGDPHVCLCRDKEKSHLGP